MNRNLAIENYFKTFVGQYKSYRKEDQWCYEDGIILKAALDLGSAINDPSYKKFVISYLDRLIDDNGHPAKYQKSDFNLDNLQSGYALISLLDELPGIKYKLAYQALRSQLEDQPTTKSGGYFHKARYPFQIWLDGLYMAEPMASLIALKEGSSIGHIFTQFNNVYTYLKDDNGDYRHAYDENRVMQWASKDSGQSPNVWLRACGWLMMACADVYELLSAEHPDESSILVKILNEVYNSLVRSLDGKKLLFKDLPFVDDPRNYYETSGTAMVSYALAKGSRLGMFKESKREEATKIFQALVEHSFDGTRLNNIVKVSGLDNEKRDGSIDYYFSESVGPDDSKGVAPFIMAYAELIGE